MDMEHYQYQLLHLSPQDHFMASPGFFFVGGGGSGYSYSPHFQAGGGFVDDAATAAGLHDGGGWVDPEDLVQLGDELFGGGDAISAGTEDHEPWQYADNGGSSEDHQLPCVSPDGGGSPPSGEQGGAGGDGASPTARSKRRDRSKTIVSERRRRVRMKEKLYELRSLVPNITKMDKASIIADAVVYVRGLQAHARKLGEEVAALEARVATRSPPAAAGPPRSGRGGGPQAGRRGGAGAGHGAWVTRVGAAEVGGGRFFVTVECERRGGVAAALFAAAESLACFRVESSSVVRAGPDRVVSTLTLKVSDQAGYAIIGEASVKLWVMAALLEEGFRHDSTCRPIN